MEQKNIAFIGAGNMARSLISGLVNAGYPGSKIHATDIDAEKARQLATEFGIAASTDNISAVKGADVVVLAVKPQFMAEMLAKLTPAVGDLGQKLIISIAAGISVTRLQALLNHHQNIVRCMPNTPSLIGLGITGLFASAAVNTSDRQFAQRMLQAVGKTVWVDNEEAINGVTAASGSGPAYFFLFMQAMVEEAQRMGFSAEVARKLVQETALGAAQMVIANPETDLATLRAQVTSKGGTTAAAISVFEEGKLAELVSAAMQAAQHRAEEMETLF
ncbi:pyrroline-5-carboxylate reductase [Tolumonas lignilytica]|jgi:pyrroline-5-carboxylate reductase|uniref:pyrroline-5-carboxylate reductase n=1 Tax=Tolumonas lignilytica TaxID=1283284 RepID=UPI00046619C4|nr:pyrroline-5-carboxylate reductase [Tolumonas lignilytica]